MKTNELLIGLWTVATAVVPGIATANLVSDAAPTLGGQPAKVAYYINGVTKNNGIETVFICTSLDSVGHLPDRRGNLR